MKRIKWKHGALALERVKRQTETGLAAGRGFFLTAAIVYFLLCLFMLGLTLGSIREIYFIYESLEVGLFLIVLVGTLLAVYFVRRPAVKKRKRNSVAFSLYRLWGITIMAYPISMLLLFLQFILANIVEVDFLLTLPFSSIDGPSIFSEVFLLMLFMTGLLTGRRWAKILAIFGIFFISAAEMGDSLLMPYFTEHYVGYYNLFSQCSRFLIPIACFALWVSLKRGQAPKEEEEPFNFEEVVTK